MEVKKLSWKILIVVALCTMNTIWGQNNSQLNKKDFSVLKKNIELNKYAQGKNKQSQYIQLIESHLSDKETDKLKIINDYINSTIQYETDMQAWNQVDYWAPPLELLNNGSGDCEDFAIVKYYGLKKIGINSNKLRLVYVQYKSYAEDIIQPHMVLSYTKENHQVLILDNLVNEIKTSDERKDLTPVFSFNDEGIYTEMNESKLKRSLSKWNEVIEKAKKEGW